MEQFMEILKRESHAAYTARSQGAELELFKVVAERRVRNTYLVWQTDIFQLTPNGKRVFLKGK